MSADAWVPWVTKTSAGSIGDNGHKWSHTVYLGVIRPVQSLLWLQMPCRHASQRQSAAMIGTKAPWIMKNISNGKSISVILYFGDIFATDHQSNAHWLHIWCGWAMLPMCSVVIWASWHLKTQAIWHFVKQLRTSAVSFWTTFAKMKRSYKRQKPVYIIKTQTIECRSYVFRPLVFLHFKTFNISLNSQ